MTPRPFRSLSSLLLLAALSACVPPPSPPPPASAALPAPCQPPRSTSGRVMPIDAAHSEIRIHVYRDGKLAHLGHNHVVSTRAVAGFLELHEPLAQSRVAICLRAADLVVDDPELRGAAGPDFERQPSASDIAGTRRNMLSATQLDADRYPDIAVTGTVQRAQPPGLELALRITVRDRTYTAPATVTLEQRNGALSARGEMALKLSDLGIEPFTALFGALRVRDTLEIRFELAAKASGG